jgi:hypothetical protein
MYHQKPTAALIKPVDPDGERCLIISRKIRPVG